MKQTESMTQEVLRDMIFWILEISQKPGISDVIKNDQLLTDITMRLTSNAVDLWKHLDNRSIDELLKNLNEN